MLEVKGTFRVNKVNMWSSNIQYAVLFFEDRMIFVKIGGQFADGGLGGAIAGGLGGALGGLIGSLIDQKLQRSPSLKKEGKVKSFEAMTIDDLLRLDKKNFEVYYGDIMRIEMKKSAMSLNGPRTGTLSIQRKKKEKFDIAPSQKYDDCLNVIQSLLPGKLSAL